MPGRILPAVVVCACALTLAACGDDQWGDLEAQLAEHAASATVPEGDASTTTTETDAGKTTAGDANSGTTPAPDHDADSRVLKIAVRDSRGVPHPSSITTNPGGKVIKLINKDLRKHALVLQTPNGSTISSDTIGNGVIGFKAKLRPDELYSYWITNDGKPSGFEGRISVGSD